MPSAQSPSDGGDLPAILACRNCGATVSDRYCPACGQLARQTDQVWDLVREWLQRQFASEPIFWSTLKLLVVDPGRLSRDWWAGRRGGLMSPVRTLFSVLVIASVVALTWQALSGRETGSPAILARFAFAAALSIGIVSMRLLPRLLPPAARRTSYDYACFALYESAFQALSALSAITLLMLAELLPWLGGMGGFVAPLALPLLALGIVAHAIVHLRNAFALGWAGAAARMVVLAVAFWIVLTLIMMLLPATGLDRLWPTPGETEFGSFHRVEP